MFESIWNGHVLKDFVYVPIFQRLYGPLGQGSISNEKEPNLKHAKLLSQNDIFNLIPVSGEVGEDATSFGSVCMRSIHFR